MRKLNKTLKKKVFRKKSKQSYSKYGGGKFTDDEDLQRARNELGNADNIEAAIHHLGKVKGSDSGIRDLNAKLRIARDNVNTVFRNRQIIN